MTQPSESSRPLVSVLVGCYNQARYVEACLDSVRRQTYRPLQLIIADDCSADDSAQVIRRWLDTHQLDTHQLDAHLIVNDTNRGVSALANAALSAATGKYIALLSADDLWAEEKLERHVELLEDLPDEVGILYGGASNIDEHGHVRPRPQRHHAPDEDIYRALVRRGSFIVSSSTLIRKVCFDVAGHYDETLLVEDYDMWLRLARRYRFVYCAEVLTFRRKHPASFSALQRNSTRWIENLLLVDLKQLGAVPDLDAELRYRLLVNARVLYTRKDARFDHCMALVLEKYRHPLLLWMRLLRNAGAPFIFGRIASRVWFTMASLRQRSNGKADEAKVAVS